MWDNRKDAYQLCLAQPYWCPHNCGTLLRSRAGPLLGLEVNLVLAIVKAVADVASGSAALLTSAGEKAAITKRVSVQLLRDTCAVRLLQHGEPMETVLEKFGLRISTWEDAKEKYEKLIRGAI